MFFREKSYLNKAIAAFVCILCVVLKRWLLEQTHKHICNTFMVRGVYIPSHIFIPTSTVHSTLTFTCLSYPMLSCVYSSLSCVYPFLSCMYPIIFFRLSYPTVYQVLRLSCEFGCLDTFMRK